MMMEHKDHLAHERGKAQFNVDAMKVVWAGSRHDLEIHDRIARLVARDPVFQKDNRAILNRKELFKNTLMKAAHAWKQIIELRLTEEEAAKLRIYVDQSGFTDLHWGMFVQAIKGQATEEQKKKWLPLATKMQIICCYAQTELGHGSNVQGLETTATFDPKSDEFIIHSPTLTSTKWWPGGLGKVSTHAVVYARLIVGGKDNGVHGFIVQLRSLDDHSPHSGITVGDIGPKFGNGAYNSMDNGLLIFDNVRIPRDQMFMRVLQVTRDGKIVKSQVPRQLSYGTMVYVRQSNVYEASTALSRAVCIATRYSAVHRQFGSQNDGLETQITKLNKLGPLLAAAFAFRFLGEWLKWLYLDVVKKLDAKDFSTLPEAHACAAGLKSLTTTFTAVARFLMKTVSQLGSGTPPVGTASYMSRMPHLLRCNSSVMIAEDWLKPTIVLESFEARAARMSANCAKNLSNFSDPEEGFAELAMDLVEAAIAHCQLIVVSKFMEKLKGDIPGEGVKRTARNSLQHIFTFTSPQACWRFSFYHFKADRASQRRIKISIR